MVVKFKCDHYDEHTIRVLLQKWRQNRLDGAEDAIGAHRQVATQRVLDEINLHQCLQCT